MKMNDPQVVLIKECICSTINCFNVAKLKRVKVETGSYDNFDLLQRDYALLKVFSHLRINYYGR